jgi:hypothetical protein
MRRTQRLLSNAQGSLVEWFGLGILSLLLVKIGQSIKRISYLRMRRTQRLLSNAQGSLVEWFGLGILSLLLVKIGQSVKGISHLRSFQT